MNTGESTSSPVSELWRGYDSLVKAGENLARGVSRGEIEPLVAYGDRSYLAELRLLSIERVNESTYLLRYEDCGGRICSLVVDERTLEEALPRTPSPCARGIPGCSLSHGPEEISAG